MDEIDKMTKKKIKLYLTYGTVYSQKFRSAKDSRFWTIFGYQSSSNMNFIENKQTSP